MSDATLIVPCAANLEGLARLLDSVPRDRAEVIVVDNGTPGEAASAIAREHSAEAIRLDRNHGYSRAINLAAREASGDALVLVNDDCVLDAGFVDAITEPLAPRGGVVMVAGAMRESRSPELIDTAGVELDRTLLAFDYLNGEPVETLASAPAPIGPSGAAAAFDRAAFLEVGGFDERLFAYLEDVDLIVRLRLAGARCALARRALGVHEHSSTLGSGSARKDRLIGFGRGYLLRRWGVVRPPRLAGVLTRELALTAGVAIRDRTAAPLRGRVEGWRAATPGHYPRAALEGTVAPGLIATLRRRIARRRRLG